MARKVTAIIGVLVITSDSLPLLHFLWEGILGFY